MTVHQPLSLHQHGSLVRHRLFVAVRPSPEAITAIAPLRRAAAGPRGVADDRLHMTLFVTDDFEAEPAALAEAMRGALGSVRADAFDVTLQAHGHFGSDLVPGRCPSLRAFQRRIADALACAGVSARAEWTRFNPHVTLAYEQAPHLSGQPIPPISWRVNEFVLIHSLLRLTMHRTIGTWRLTEQPLLL